MSSAQEQVQASPTRGNRGGLFSMRARLPGGVEITFLQVCLVAGLVFYGLVTPGDLTYKMDALGFGVCHQISTHSFFVDGHQLPLCARCSGIYLGALSTVVLLVLLRGRSVRLPVASMITILVIFFVAMVTDGINSTFQQLGQSFWDSTNIVRLLTGSLAGVAVAFFLYPLFNLSLWSRDVSKRQHVLESPLELAGYMVAAGVLVALVLDRGDWLFYPLSILSVVGMLTMLTIANTMLVLMVSRREAAARDFTQALTPILVAVVLSVAEVSLLAWGRASLAPFMANNLGMPVVPGLS